MKKLLLVPFIINSSMLLAFSLIAFYSWLFTGTTVWIFAPVDHVGVFFGLEIATLISAFGFLFLW